MKQKNLYFLVTIFLFSCNNIYFQIDEWNVSAEGSDWITQVAERDNNLKGWFDLSETYHSPTSLEISFPSGKSGSSNTYAAFEKTYNLNDIIPDKLTPSEYHISVSVKDNYTGSDSGYFFKQVLVNNRIVWEDDAAGNEGNSENGWQDVDINITNNMPLDSQILNITLRVYQKNDINKFGVKTFWDNFIIHFDKNTNRKIRQERLKGTLATYAGMGPVSFNGDDEGRTDDQDVTELINEILYSNSNTYAFLFYYENDTLNKAHHWKLFNERILDSLLKNDLKVWVYLVPPSESANWKSEPYQTDYERWAKEIAGLSIENEGLTALAIDDFDGNLNGIYTPDFTISYVQNFVSKMQDINPFLAFIPVSYYYDNELLRNQKRLNAYGNNFDAVLFPYLLNMTNDGINNYKHNLWNTTDLKDQIDEIKTNLKNIPNLDPDPLLIVDVYATSYYSTKPYPVVSTPEYVLEIGQKALEYADGVCYYLLQRERETTDKEKRKREAIRTLFSNSFVENPDTGKRIYVFSPGDQIITSTGLKENFLYSPYWFDADGVHNFNNFKYNLAGDFDGDGYDEIALFCDFAGSQNIFVYKAGKTSKGLPTYSFNFTGSWLDSSVKNFDFNLLKSILAADFNGNGKDEIALFFSKGSFGDEGNVSDLRQRVLVYEKHEVENKFVLLKGTETGGSWLNYNVPEFDSGKIITGDFNGNKIDNIALFHDGSDTASQKNFIYEKHESENKFVLLKGNEPDGSWFDNSAQGGVSQNILAGDFNGNGRDDLAFIYKNDNADSILKISIYEKHITQKHFVPLTDSATGLIRYLDHNSESYRHSISGDFDGDRVDEIAFFYECNNSSDSRQRIYIYKLDSACKFILTYGSEEDNSWFNQKLNGFDLGPDFSPMVAQFYDEDESELNREELVVLFNKK